jgi:hypothetical protein
LELPVLEFIGEIILISKKNNKKINIYFDIPFNSAFANLISAFTFVPLGTPSQRQKAFTKSKPAKKQTRVDVPGFDWFYFYNVRLF